MHITTLVKMTSKIPLKLKAKIPLLSKVPEKKYEGLSPQQLKDIEQNGYIILPNVFSKQECDEAISELWDILEATPHKPEYQIKRPNDPLAPLTSAKLKELDKNWVPHKNYGMFNENPVWHTKAHWKARQNPLLHQVYSQLLGTEAIWCTIDRASIKLPGQGEEEFNHWDADPWHPLSFPSFQGIINLCERHFRCVPGSHKVEWHNDFKNEYKYLASNEQRPMVMIKKEQDSWNLGQILPNDHTPAKTKYNCIRDIICPAGSMIIFNNRTMHSVARNTSDKIVYALYLSFTQAGSRDFMSVHNKPNWSWSALHPFAKNGDTELADRIRSYQTGMAPYRFPGGGITQYVPLRTFAWVIRKRDPSTVGKHPNTGNPWVFEQKPKNYVPPPLTALGRKILGLDPWETVKYIFPGPPEKM